MTCVVGVVDEKGGVHFGCDSLGSDGHSGTILSSPKICQNGEFLFGYAGSFRGWQLLQYSLVPPARGEKETSIHYLCTSFIDTVRLTFELGRYISTISIDDEDELANSVTFDGEFIIGYRGEIFLVQNDFSVLQAVDDFTAIGSGGETANAVLYATSGLELEPIDRLHLALDAAEYQITSVKAPYHFLSMEPNDPKKKNPKVTKKKTSKKASIA